MQNSLWSQNMTCHCGIEVLFTVRAAAVFVSLQHTLIEKACVVFVCKVFRINDVLLKCRKSVRWSNTFFTYCTTETPFNYIEKNIICYIFKFITNVVHEHTGGKQWSQQIEPCKLNYILHTRSNLLSLISPSKGIVISYACTIFPTFFEINAVENPVLWPISNSTENRLWCGFYCVLRCVLLQEAKTEFGCTTRLK